MYSLLFYMRIWKIDLIVQILVIVENIDKKRLIAR